MTELTAVSSGTVISLRDVPDKAFSEGILGDGVAIEPEEGLVVAPADGQVTMVLKSSGHGLGLKIDGISFLIHVGVNTVKLKGEGFVLCVKAGDQVKKGQKLLAFQKELLEQKGFCSHVIFIRMKKEEPLEREVTFRWGTKALAGQTIIGWIED